MHKVNSVNPLDDLLYMAQADGSAQIWLRQNQEEGVVIDSDGTESAFYEADEIYAVVTAEVVSEKEIRNDVAFWFAQLSDKKEGINADYLQIEAVRAAKRAEISQICNATIFGGVDVLLSDGSLKHFSMTDEDQLNLFGKQAQLAAGMEQVEYHSDGEACRFYSAADAMLIINAAMAFKTFHTTYTNSAFQWIKALRKASTISAITYGDAIPEQYQSDVLKALYQEAVG